LRAGLMVLADRYIYTLMVRDMVRGMDLAWLKNLYGIAVVPDVVFYLNVLPEQLVERNFAKNQSLDFWESGMDLGLSRDMFDSFLQYQSLVAVKFKELQATYGFTIVDGHRTPDEITLELRKRIESVLAGK
jgi:dTMP kinase